ncbi:UNVERIFIED_CONTAM: hypothetical protein K2H54_066513, partial [Gekko kuhli]
EGGAREGSGGGSRSSPGSCRLQPAVALRSNSGGSSSLFLAGSLRSRQPPPLPLSPVLRSRSSLLTNTQRAVPGWRGVWSRHGRQEEPNKAEAAAETVLRRGLLGLQRVHFPEQRRGLQVHDVRCEEGHLHPLINIRLAEKKFL